MPPPLCPLIPSACDHPVIPSCALPPLEIPELLELILELYAQSRSRSQRDKRRAHLPRVAVVSKAFYAAATARLYANLYFTFLDSSPAQHTLLQRTLAARPDLAAHARLAHFTFWGNNQNQTLRDVRQFTQLRHLKVDIVEISAEMSKAALLSDLPLLRSLEVKLSYLGKLASIPRDYLQYFLSAPNHDQSLSIRFDCLSFEQVDAYTHFLGDRVHHLELSCTGGTPTKELCARLLSDLSSLQRLMVDDPEGILVVSLLAALRSGAGVQLQHFDIRSSPSSQVAALELLANPATLPGLRTTPPFYLDAPVTPIGQTSRSANMKRRPSRPEIGVSLTEAAWRGLEERRFWSPTAMSPWRRSQR